MNFVIDQGNTSIKFAVFDKDILVFQSSVDSLSEEQLESLLSKYDVQKILLSSVGNVDKLPIRKLESLPFFRVLDNQTPVPLKNCYDTPLTLGMDRMASCVGAYSLCPNHNLLVVDMGTCITYDVVGKAGEFLGGNIAPGLEMRLKALNHYTSKLPLVSVSEDVPLYGRNTNDAILSGVVNGIVYEIEGYARSLEEKYEELSIFLTGGNSFFFERRLKNRIFANRNLLLIGLNRILDNLDV